MKNRYKIVATLILLIVLGCGDNNNKKDSKSDLNHKVNSGKETIVTIKKNTFDNEDADTSSIIKVLQKNAKGYTLSKVNYFKYVTAKNGLVYRDTPEGKKQHKFSYGTKLEVVGETDKEMAVTDKGQEIIGKWIAVKKDEFSSEIVFVFDGFLGDSQDVDHQSVITKSPVVFEKTSERALILPGKHTIYNKKLKKVSQLTVDKIGSVYIVEKTVHKRPLQKQQEYCDWANYIEVIYGREKFVLFGNKILKIVNSKEIKLPKNTIDFLVVKNFSTEASDKNGLTFCNDFSEVLIKENNNYEYLQHEKVLGKESKGNKVFVHGNGVSEKISDIEVKEEHTIVNIKQTFKGGTGRYKIKVFNKNGWKFNETEVQRKYE